MSFLITSLKNNSFKIKLIVFMGQTKESWGEREVLRKSGRMIVTEFTLFVSFLLSILYTDALSLFLPAFGLATLFLVWQIKKHIPEIGFSMFLSFLLHSKYLNIQCKNVYMRPEICGHGTCSKENLLICNTGRLAIRKVLKERWPLKPYSHLHTAFPF